MLCILLEIPLFNSKTAERIVADKVNTSLHVLRLLFSQRTTSLGGQNKGKGRHISTPYLHTHTHTSKCVTYQKNKKKPEHKLNQLLEYRKSFKQLRLNSYATNVLERFEFIEYVTVHIHCTPSTFSRRNNDVFDDYQH